MSLPKDGGLTPKKPGKADSASRIKVATKPATPAKPAPKTK